MHRLCKGPWNYIGAIPSRFVLEKCHSYVGQISNGHFMVHCASTNIFHFFSNIELFLVHVLYAAG